MRRTVGHDAAVAKRDHTARVRGDVGVVGDDDDGGSLTIELGKELEHLSRGGRIERARRLVGEQKQRRIDHGARDRDALLLASRELPGPMVHAVGEPYAFERCLGAPASLARTYAGVNHR